jgi:hypothetical protein
VVVAEVKELLLLGMTELHHLYIMAQEKNRPQQLNEYFIKYLIKF